MPEAPPCDAWKARPLYWATLAYQRAFWATDGAHLALVRENQGLTVPLLRQIGDEYRVNRWIPGPEKSEVQAQAHPGIADDPSAGLYCRLLNDAWKDWPRQGLTARAEACAVIAQKAAVARVSGSGLASATTKFMWFLRPEGWTVFDSLACKGMGLDPGKGPAVDRMLAFYARLARAGFEDLVAGMEAEIAPTLLTGLHAPRILDSLLMGRAGAASDELGVARLRAFRDLLPPPVRDALHALAESLDARFRAHALARPDYKAMP